MKANELRVGNLVTYRSLKELKVMELLSTFTRVLIDNNQTDWISVGYDFLDPIPLTEEWLLKFGFEKTKENFLTYDLGKLSIYMPSFHYKKGRTYFNSWVIIEESPKTVHQLQNLYFCLCGKELELNKQNVM